MYVPQRIKADYYDQHLYVSMIMMALEDIGAAENGSRNVTFDSHVPRHTIAWDRKRLPLGILYPELQLNLMSEQASFLLLNDGTLISIFQKQGASVTKHIMQNLTVRGRSWRTSPYA